MGRIKNSSMNLQWTSYISPLPTDSTMNGLPSVPCSDIAQVVPAMDMTYALSFTCYTIRTQQPKTIKSVTARLSSDDQRVDAAMYAYLTFIGPQNTEVHSQIYTDMEREWIGGFVPRSWDLPPIEVETERATIFFYNAMMPLYHYISITDKIIGQAHWHKQHKGGPLWGNVATSGGKGGSSLWSTYRWQLEALVDAVKGKTPAYWIPVEDSICQMECIDVLYQAAGLPVCGALAKKG